MGEWIRCSERLPETMSVGRRDRTEFVLGFWPDSEDGPLCVVARLLDPRGESPRWFDGDAFWEFDSITHWQPLPAPPGD